MVKRPVGGNGNPRAAALAVCAALSLLALALTGGCDRQDNNWNAYDPQQKVMSVLLDTLRLDEGGEPRTVSVALLMVPDDTVRVVFSSAQNQTWAHPDTLVFPPVDDDWARRLSTEIYAVDDRIAEGPHADAMSVVAYSRDPDYDGQGGPDALPVLLSDDDTPGVAVSETLLTLIESEQGVLSERYHLNLMSQPLDDVTITVAAAPVDPTFHVDPSVLTFTPQDWSVEQTVTVWSELDANDADDASFVLSHATASTDPNYGAGLAVAPVDVDVYDGTLPPIATVALAVPGSDTLDEALPGDQTAVTVILNLASTVPVQLHLATEDGTATGGLDFVPIDRDITFAPGGALQQTFTVDLLNDTLLEDTETFSVVLTGISGAIIGDADRVELRIADDDWTTLTLSVADVDEDSGSADFVVSMPKAEPIPIGFSLVTADGTALAGSDYQAVDEAFIIEPGSTQRVIPVVLLADPDHEPDETFSASLADLTTNAVWDGVPVACTILNDDPQAVTLDDVTVIESAGVAEFTLRLASPYNAPVNLTVNTLAGDGVDPAGAQDDAVPGGDYGSLTGASWVVPAHATTATFTVGIALDMQAEALEERFRLTIATASQPGFAGVTATCTIIDDDQPFVVMDDVSVTETATEAAFQVRLENAAGTTVSSTADVTVRVTSEDQTATAPDDYTAIDQVVTIAAGTTGTPVTVVLHDDVHDDDSETFVMHLADPVNAVRDAALPDPFCAITDDEFPSINLAMVRDRANEGTVFEFTVNLTTPRQAATTYSLLLSPGTSEGEGQDYTFGLNGPQLIPPFVSSVTFPVTFLDDQLAGEGDEMLDVALTGANVALGVDGLDFVIVDAPQLTIGAAAALEGDPVVFPVTLSAPSTADVTFRVQYSSDTANVGLDIDNSNSGPFTIAAGQSGTVLQVPTIAGDGGDWTVETFTVTLINPGNATLSPFNSATGSITDGDPPPLTIAGDASAVEGDAVEFTVNLGWSSEADVQFSVTFTDGAAVGAGIDYDDTVTGPYTVPAGSTSLTVAVPTAVDGGPELEDEDFTIALAGPVHAVLGGATSAVGHVLDADQPQLSIPAGDTVVEGGTLAFTVQMDRQSIVPVLFDLQFLNGSTQGASDFTAPAGPFSMMPGTTDTTITVTTVDDAVFENQEIFVVRLGADPLNAVVGSPNQANGTINDNDP